MSFSLCVAQLNFTVGDMAGNARKIIDAAHAAHAQGARLLLTPEGAISGYIAEDLLLRPAFMAACDEAVQTVARQTAGLQDLVIVVGHPVGRDARGPSVTVSERHNAASVICNGQVTAGAELLAVINASPFHLGKGAEREAVMRERARDVGLPLVWAHWVGGQDEVVFDGQSFAVNADGTLAGRAPAFEEKLWFAQVEQARPAIEIKADVAPPPSPERELWDALVLGLRDYVRKNGFKSVALGLSGGIDSALVLAIAVDALGADAVHTVMMPSPYTAGISVQDAHEMARRLGVRHTELSPLRMRATLHPTGCLQRCRLREKCRLRRPSLQ